MRPSNKETGSGERTAATIYLLVMLTPWTLGASGIVAGVWAARRARTALGLARSHFQFQIRALWIAFWAVVAALIVGGFVVVTTALCMLFNIFDDIGPRPELAVVNHLEAVLITSATFLIVGLIGSTVIWLTAASFWGRSLLASGREMRRATSGPTA